MISIAAVRRFFLFVTSTTVKANVCGPGQQPCFEKLSASKKYNFNWLKSQPNYLSEDDLHAVDNNVY